MVIVGEGATYVQVCSRMKNRTKYLMTDNLYHKKLALSSY